MKLSGEAYDKRLREFSDDTIRLIMQAHGLDKESVFAASEIASESDLTEEQVAEQLRELIATAQQKKDTK
jgi:hypothetical protein